MVRPMAASTANRSSSSISCATTIVTIDNSSGVSSSSQPQEAHVLKLRPRKKKVTWKEGTVDNEFMNKKSSKICCIYHKEKPFDEDDSDDEGHDHHHQHPSNGHGSSKDGCGSSSNTSA
ncbi:Stabilizer of iron transporter SufD / Polynucleotidyl transferase isoform 1 [Hibiscus syriacus]|uniref:Stabilizer of iron transporter SufD / Polynucleotidyl transferase isoform 1 n=1 Tax=Hibiscus syriacus TaxID=106335 RepID=A0A6A3BCK0_HIBSY|nr:protein phosphatase 1 regulatory subunit INH3-like [Hibiscus syriacus]KAE8714750.1 Stabilizer of iron transporter SufD / Polynucleotidyl transferase isoform 1 [Hibiscus syriacus]